MQKLFPLISAVVLLTMPISAFADTKDDVEATTHAWVAAYDSRDPENILALYANDAVFWGTTSPTLRDAPDEVRDYFKNMASRPHARVEIGEHRVRVFGDVAINTGFYTFSDVRDGEATTFPARFSFVYRKQDNGRWLIVDHHSSAIPPPRK